MAEPDPQQPPPAPGAARPQQTTSGIIALVFGILQFVALPVIGAIVALVAGYSSRNDAANNPALSDDLGRVGRILGWIGLALAAAFILLIVVIFIVGFSVTGFEATTAGPVRYAV